MNECHGRSQPARSVAIQAGGQSSRFGEDKGLIRLAGKPLIEHVIARVDRLTSDLLLTTNRPDAYRYLGVRMAADQRPSAGALEGLRTALRWAKGGRVLLVACDMPFLSRELLVHLLKESKGALVTIPLWGGRLQPLCAVYSAVCLSRVEGLLETGEQRVLTLLEGLEPRVVEESQVARFDPSGLSFFNINTREDLRCAESIYADLAAEGQGPVSVW